MRLEQIKQYMYIYIYIIPVIAASVPSLDKVATPPLYFQLTSFAITPTQDRYKK